MKSADISRLVGVGAPAVSPDGSLVAYVVTRVDLAANRYRSAVWLAPTDGCAPPRQLTSGRHRDDTPAWSPDGRRLAFVSDRGEPGAPKTLHVLPVDGGGETVTLLARDEDVAGPAWSPDGSRLAFASRVRAGRYGPEDDRARPPRRVDRLFPRLDDVGWTVDRPTQLFVVPADGSGPPEQVTDGPYEHAGPAWSPDGSRLAFTAARHPDADLDVVNDVWVLPVGPAGGGGAPVGEPTRVTGTDADHANPSWSPDGTRIAVLRTPAGVGYRHAQVALAAPEGGPLRCPTEALDLTCAPYPGARSPVWHHGGAVFAVEDSGRVHLYRLDGEDVERLVEGERCVTGYDARGGVLAFVSASAVGPTELSVLVDGQERRLTDHQGAFLAACPPLAPERFPVRSEDGTPLDAWVIRPAGLAEGERAPALLNVHGGPHTQYGERWFDEFQLYASAGFAVVYCNPHGSTGRTEAFGRAILPPESPVDPGTGWGGIDYRDCMAALDAALERFAFIDPERVGIIGGSYGGYLASWAIGSTRRFASACSERAVNNLLSLEWSSDAAGCFRHEFGISHLDHPEAFLRMSPISRVREIETPVLILHSEDDLRCPVEQADCLWVALRLLGKRVEYYRFPAESHELTRSGSPRHRVQRADLVIDWFTRTLGGAA